MQILHAPTTITYSYTPVAVVDSNEKDWAYKIGLMDWDDTKIVFTKRSLIDFLKHVDVTVDTNLAQLSKLPRFAEFGKISGEAPAAAAPAEASAPKAAPVAARAPADPSDPSWVPTRRVRTAPGGTQTFSFGDDEEVAAPPPRVAPVPAPAPAQPAVPVQASKPEAPADTGYRVVDNDGNLFKPTRRVRDTPGGRDSVHALFSDS
ncbi:hypothetical protein FRC06_006340 [Ceratobasidium sp. 370]|nr:hypothetical protein FRC06_006340 [Ceratobasidium sp. 370]